MGEQHSVNNRFNPEFSTENQSAWHPIPFRIGGQIGNQI